MIKLNDMSWEERAIDANKRVELATKHFDKMQEQIYELESDIEQLKTIIEYLEVKLGINHPV
jgi:peptidoglycan hydrolase CwlO-like protein